MFLIVYLTVLINILQTIYRRTKSMSKVFREWIENVDEDSDEYKKFIAQQEYDEFMYNNMMKMMDAVEAKTMMYGNQINDLVWDSIMQEIAQLELTLDDTHMARVDDIALVNGLHPDDDRDEILDILAEEMLEERMI